MAAVGRILAFLFVCIPIAASAASVESVCSGTRELADGVMSARQEGIPMPKVMEMVAEVAAERPELDVRFWRDLVEAATKDAYGRPRHETREMQLWEIDDFASEVHLDCLNTAQRVGWNLGPGPTTGPHGEPEEMDQILPAQKLGLNVGPDPVIGEESGYVRPSPTTGQPHGEPEEVDQILQGIVGGFMISVLGLYLLLETL